MFDGIASDATVIPVGAQLVAGYVDGDYVWTLADWTRFPGAIHVGIAVRSTTDAGIVLDVETGNASPEEAVNWVLARRHAGADPTVYCGESSWATVRAAFATHDVPEPHWWVANYNGDTSIPAGAIAHQYENTARWDVSSVADYWPGVDPAPATTPGPPKPAAAKEDHVTYFPIQVLPDPAGSVNACGVATWPADPNVPHVLQLVADPGKWGDIQGEFEVVFSQKAGPDVKVTVLAKPSESVAIELDSVAGLDRATLRGVTITRPDGKKWPWGGGAQ
jgi:hypothetical protein